MASRAFGQDLRVGLELGHYRIVEKIGAGGMGEVYRARDEHLDRDVAIKILPSGTLADELTQKRFRKEALALSKLNHPNIATVYDFDTQGSTDFLVMEYVAGCSLGDRLLAGKLPENDVLRIGTELAEGVAAAHERGIIHRDLKPGNLRLTVDGRLKILDFGLAKLLRGADTDLTVSITKSQGAAGTLPYMAPEQLRGKAVDARTDIYGAGAVLYELATGHLPFDEHVPTMLADRILHEPPPSPRQLVPELSSRFQELILKCLEKEPANRYQSMADLLLELRRLAVPKTKSAPAAVRRPKTWIIIASSLVLALTVISVLGTLWWRKGKAIATPRIESLAVLPLINLTHDPEQEYFADGMTEALITELSRINSLKVISRTSVMRYKAVSKPLPEIARELGVDGIIEGSVLRAGDRVRITIQLIYAPADSHVWANSYDRDLHDILGLQTEVADAITVQVRAAVSREKARKMAAIRSVDPEAYNHYLQGRFWWNKRTAEAMNRASEYFTRAIEIDPSYAPAYAGLADTLMILSSYSVGIESGADCQKRSDGAPRDRA